MHISQNTVIVCEHPSLVIRIIATTYYIPILRQAAPEALKSASVSLLIVLGRIIITLILHRKTVRLTDVKQPTPGQAVHKQVSLIST